jgi:hypothetical protein
MSAGGSVMALLTALQLVGEAVVEPSGRAYYRLLVLAWMTALLLVLGCALGIAWRIGWPQLPELHLPVIMV